MAEVAQLRGQVARLEEELRAAEGALHKVHDTLAPQTEVEGRLHAIITIDAGQKLYTAIVRDITLRRQMEDELRDKSQMLTSILENLPVSVLRIDEEGRFSEISGAALKTVGVQDGELVGQSALENFPAVADQIQSALAGGTAHFPISISHAGKTVHFDAWLFFDAANGRGAIGFAVDVTARKRAEEERVRLNAELDRRVADRTRELQALYEVMSVASQSLDLQPMLEQVLDRVLDALERPAGTIHLLDETGQVLRLSTHLGFRSQAVAELEAISLEDTLEAQVVAHGKPLVVRDLATHAPHLAQSSGLHGYAGVPIRARGQIVGVLSLFDETGVPFNVEQLALLTSIADQVGVAMQNIQLLAQTRRRMEILDVLLRADRELHSHLQVEQVLQVLVDVAVNVAGADKSAVLAWDEGRQTFSVAAARNLSPETMAQSCLVAGHVAAMEDLVVVEDTSADARIAGDVLVAAEGVRAFLSTPIRVGEEPFAAFWVGYGYPVTFGRDEQGFFVALARQAALAIANARLYQQVRQVAALEERRRLARELHDSATQSLYGLVLLTETGRQLAQSAPAELPQGYLESHLARIGETAQQVLNETRLLLYELQPAALVQQTLAEALEQRLDTVEKRAGVKIRLAADIAVEPRAPVKEALYRIAQEALNNILKHAAASSVMVYLASNKEQAQLEIVDDGKGFDLNAPENSHGLGLTSIRERVEELDGALAVRSAPGQGTSVKVTIKMGQGAAAGSR